MPILGVNREDIYEIPIEVLREAMVNALMHRDYSITGTQVSVEVYDDRVEIVNPGGLLKGLSVKDLGTLSIRRNELIADLFFRLHKVERIGMGIQKMKEAMAAAGLREPAFASDAFFRAIFQRSLELALKKGEKGTKKGSEKVRRKYGHFQKSRTQPAQPMVTEYPAPISLLMSDDKLSNFWQSHLKSDTFQHVCKSSLTRR